MLRKRKMNGVKIGPLDLHDGFAQDDIQARPSDFEGKISSKSRVLRKSYSLQDEPLSRHPSLRSPTVPYDHFITSTTNCRTEDREGNKNGEKREKSMVSTNSSICKCGRTFRSNSSHWFSKNNKKTGYRLQKSASFSNGYFRNLTNECDQCQRNDLSKDSPTTFNPPLFQRNVKNDLKVKPSIVSM